jgi:hypothetical protein
MTAVLPVHAEKNVVSPIPALVPSQKIVPRPDQQPCLKEIPDAT